MFTTQQSPNVMHHLTYQFMPELPVFFFFFLCGVLGSLPLTHLIAAGVSNDRGARITNTDCAEFMAQTKKIINNIIILLSLPFLKRYSFKFFLSSSYILERNHTAVHLTTTLMTLSNDKTTSPNTGRYSELQRLRFETVRTTTIAWALQHARSKGK